MLAITSLCKETQLYYTKVVFTTYRELDQRGHLSRPLMHLVLASLQTQLDYVMVPMQYSTVVLANVHNYTMLDDIVANDIFGEIILIFNEY